MTTQTVNLASAEFDRLLDAAGGPLLVDFWAEWCAPCRTLGPVIEQVAEQYSDRATVAKVDIEANPDLARRYNVRSIPTVMLFENGQPSETFVGVRPLGDYTGALDAALA